LLAGPGVAADRLVRVTTNDFGGSSADSVPQTPTGVGRTALMVAAVRAMETTRAKPLFTDPYAADFLAAAGAGDLIAVDSEDSDAPGQMWSSFADYAPIRTRFFDDYLVDAARDVSQVVIVAAGLDTRALRLAWPREVTVYELDTPEVLEFKQHVLDARGAQSSGRRVPVPVDLREDWSGPLREAGLDPAVGSGWLVEGLTGYLTPEQNDALLADITALCAPGSLLSMEYLDVHAVDLMVRAFEAGGGDQIAALWRGGGVADESAAWFDRHGWDARAYDVYERAAGYGRELPPLGDTPLDRFSAAARESLVVARRRG
jgi:methyltransferase (TIGR00027 family)